MDMAPPSNRPSGTRAEWGTVPGPVRAAVARVAGADVVTAVTQPHGFSPSVAVRCRLADGRRVFVKAVGAVINPETPAMHRREIEIVRDLPAHGPFPQLLGSFDDGDWVALVFEDVDGRHPASPWMPRELDAVMAGLAELHATLTPSPVASARTVAEKYDTDFRGFRTLAASPRPGLDSWTTRHLEELARLESGWAAHARGDTLVHSDVRADNVILTETGDHTRAWFVDWAGGCVAQPWFDPLGMVPSVALESGMDPGEILARYPGPQPSHDDLVPVLTALAGHFTYKAGLPAPASMPTVRAFQNRQGESARMWLRTLTGMQ